MQEWSVPIGFLLYDSVMAGKYVKVEKDETAEVGKPFLLLSFGILAVKSVVGTYRISLMPFLELDSLQTIHHLNHLENICYTKNQVDRIP